MAGKVQDTLEIPVMPDILKPLGERQAAIRTWFPLILLMIIGVSTLLPLQHLSVTETTEADTEMTTEYSLYLDHYEVDIDGMDEFIATDEANLSMYSHLEESYSLSHGDGINRLQLEDKEFDTGAIAESHSDTIWWTFLFAFILILLTFERSTNGWLVRKFPRHTEIVSALVALSLLVFLIMGLGDFFTLGQAAPEAIGHPSFEGGLFGDASMGDESALPESIAWSPGLILWVEMVALMLIIPLLLLYTMESMSSGWWGKTRSSNIMSLFKSSKQKMLSETITFAEKGVKTASAIPTISAISALLLISTALFLPWMTFSQSILVEQEGETESTWSSHPVEWELGLFSSSFTNSTLFESSEDISPSDEAISGDSAKTTRSIIDDQMSNMFFALFILIIPLILAFIPSEKRNRFGSSRIWLAMGLLLSCLMLNVVIDNLSTGGQSFVNDAKMLRADEGLIIDWQGAGDGGTMGYIEGQAFHSDAPWIGELITTTWSTGPAVLLLNIAIIALFIGGLVALTGLHEFASRQTGGFGLITAHVHGDTGESAGWLAAPDGTRQGIAFAGVSTMLILTLIFGGVLEGIFVSSGTTAGPGLTLYNVDLNDRLDDSATDGTLTNEEVMSLTIDLPATNVENVTFIHFRAGCSDNVGDFGSNNPVGEDTDSIRIEIQLPESFGGDILVEEEDCVNNWSFIQEFGDDKSNDRTVTIEARDAQSAAERFSDDSMMITVEVTITAITKGSLVGTGVNEDDELYAAFYSSWQGYYGLVSEAETE
ncbi:MAG TPA: hypothetical protein EYQ73_04970 [Candidatus Poseidoniales archaeon]|nr:hypothetical protein [Candidatus Poseidoniales archaeon]